MSDGYIYLFAPTGDRAGDSQKLRCGGDKPFRLRNKRIKLYQASDIVGRDGGSADRHIIRYFDDNSKYDRKHHKRHH